METLTSESLAMSLKSMELETDGSFRAMFARYNEIDKGGDLTLPGAFGRQKVVISSYNHGSTQGDRLPVGKGIIYDGTEGGICEGKFFLNTSGGRETYETVKELGDLQEWSYYLPEVESERTVMNGRPVRILKKIKVKEVCPVLRGMGSTRTLSVKEDYMSTTEKVSAIQRDLATMKPVRRNGSHGELKSLGEFVQKLVASPNELKAMGINSGEDGGFAVPDLWAGRLFMIDPLAQYVRSRALVLGAGQTDGKTELPAFRQGPGGTLTVMTFSQVQEGTAGTSNSPKLDMITLEPQRSSAYVTLANSLLRSQQQLSTWLENAFRKAKAAVEEGLFLAGTGGPQPVGFLSSACKLSVTRATAYAITFADVANMAKAQQNLAGSIFIVSQSALPQVEQLRAPDGTLLHLPMYYSNRLPTLGASGDIILVDCSKYIILDGVDISVRASPHVGWTQDTTLLKFTWWLDACCGVKAPLTMEDGTTVSPIVALN